MTPPPTTTGSHSTHKARISPWWWVAAGAGAVVTVVSLIIWLGSTNAADGDPLLDNPTAIVVALLAGMTSIGSIVIPKLQAIGKNTSQTAEHVVNSHGDTNMRDDLDEIKRYVKSTDARVGQLEKTQGHQSLDILGIREEMGQIRRDGRDQWAAIEDTAGKIRQKGCDRD